jgi:hypothetical protein
MDFKSTERVLDWPYCWGLAFGSLTLPLVHIIGWGILRGFFPEIEAASRIDDITSGDSWFGDLVVAFAFSLPHQVLWGALLGGATEVVVREHLVQSRSARPLAVICGAVGTYYFSSFVRDDWTTLLHPSRNRTALASALISVIFVTAPFLWSLLLVLVGICLQSPSKKVA